MGVAGHWYILTTKRHKVLIWEHSQLLIASSKPLTTNKINPEFAKSGSPQDFTTKILHRTDTILVFFNRSNSEDQQIFFKDHQGKKDFANSVNHAFKTKLSIVHIQHPMDLV